MEIDDIQPNKEKEDDEQPPIPQEATADGLPWYAIRLFSLRLKAVLSYFKEAGLECFVPMEYAFKETPKGSPRRTLRPVVHNLVFIKKKGEESELKRIIAQAEYKMSVIRKTTDSKAYYEIPAKQMLDFMIMCNPDIELRKYIGEEEAHLKAGTPVQVKFGALKGLNGKLVRSSGKYFLLKEVPGMAVMIKVSRWCCVPG